VDSAAILPEPISWLMEELRKSRFGADAAYTDFGLTECDRIMCPLTVPI